MTRQCTPKPTHFAAVAVVATTPTALWSPPCWYCSGLVRQFNIGAVVIGEAQNFHGGHDWLGELGVEIIVLGDRECIQLLGTFIREYPDVWDEDIGL
jgi:creatinine deaminase